MLIASVNQDRGIRPDGRKGAAVHLRAMREAFQALGADVVAIDSPSAPTVAEALETLHANGPIDLVYERHALDALSAGEFCARRGVSHVLEVNAPLRSEAVAHRSYRSTAELERAEDRLFGAASTLLAVSSEVAEHLIERGAPEARVLVRPNGVDTGMFRPRPHCAGQFVLGFFGRLRPWHGFERLVLVASRLLARGVDLRLELVGEGDFAEHIGDLLPRSRWTHTEWMPQRQLAEHVAGFDALALTYAPDAPCYFSPLKLLEAMASGVVPCVPALGDLETTVRHGLNGLVHDPHELGELESQLARLASEPADREQLGAAARVTATRHSWTSIARDVLGSVGLEAPA